MTFLYERESEEFESTVVINVWLGDQINNNYMLRRKNARD